MISCASCCGGVSTSAVLLKLARKVPACMHITAIGFHQTWFILESTHIYVILSRACDCDRFSRGEHKTQTAQGWDDCRIEDSTV